MTGRSRSRVGFVSSTQRRGLKRWIETQERAMAESGCDVIMFSSRPLHLRRHRRQDRIHIAAGLEAERGAAIVEQVELDVASATDQLLFAVGRGPGRIEIPAHQFG